MKEIQCRFCGFPIRHGKKFCGGCGKNAALATQENKLPAQPSNEAAQGQSAPAQKSEADVSGEQGYSRSTPSTQPNIVPQPQTGVRSNSVLTGEAYPLREPEAYPLGGGDAYPFNSGAEAYPLGGDANPFSGEAYPMTGGSSAEFVGGNGGGNPMLAAVRSESVGGGQRQSNAAPPRPAESVREFSEQSASGSYPLTPPAVTGSSYPAYPGSPAPVQEKPVSRNNAGANQGQRPARDDAARAQSSSADPGTAAGDKQYLPPNFFESKLIAKGKKPPVPKLDAALKQSRTAPESQTAGQEPQRSANTSSNPANNYQAEGARQNARKANSPAGRSAQADSSNDSNPRVRSGEPDFFDMAPSRSPGGANRPAPPPGVNPNQFEAPEDILPSPKKSSRPKFIEDDSKDETNDSRSLSGTSTPSAKSGKTGKSAAPQKQASWIQSNAGMLRATGAVIGVSVVLVLSFGIFLCLQKPRTTAGPVTIDGFYKTVRKDNKNNVVTGTLKLQHQGSDVSGTGVQINDAFQVSGSVDENNHVRMEQVFLNRDGSVNRHYMPINIDAQLTINKDIGGNDLKSLVGTCSADTPGRNLISRMRIFRPQWIATESSINTGPSSPIGWLTDTSVPILPKLFLLLFGCIAFGLTVVTISFKVFGTNGVMNRRETKKYIPSKDKGEHDKVLKELAAPLKPGGIPLGARKDWSPPQPKNLCVPPNRRKKNPSCLVVGSAGQGKTRLIESMIRHDIESNDRAVVVIDSEGPLIDRLVHWLAAYEGKQGAEMRDRVRVIDPLLSEQTYGYNPLAFVKRDDLNQIASAVVSGFKCIYMEAPGSQNQWTQQTANILRNAVILLGLNGKTLADLPKVLSDNDFRDLCLANVEANNKNKEHEVLLDAWANYKRTARTEQWLNWIEPIINRLQPVMADTRIRRLLCDKKLSINPIETLEERLILLVKVPRARLEQGAGLLGSLIVTGIRQAAVKLSEHEEENPCPCALYVDEMSEFIDRDCFEGIAGESRQLQIGLTGVMRSVQSLPEDFRNSLSKSVGLLIAFAMTRKDAELIGPQMFRVDGRKRKVVKPKEVVDLNATPQFELVSDEEKLNIDRLTGQEEQTFFFYLVGSIAGVFQMKAPVLKDIDKDSVDRELVEELYAPISS